jgi:tripartite-type tricarboxylate transporter receptor subunit TctC
MKRRLTLLMLAMMCGCGVVAAQEPAWPTRPINIVVPFAAGGSSDILARVVEPVMSRYLGQPLIILNRPGAAGNLAMEGVAKSAPDGYTVFVGNSLNFVRNYLEFKDVRYAPKDFTLVARIGDTPLVLVVHPDLPVRSVKELIDYARANPDTIRYGAQGPRSLDIHLIRNDQKISMVEVPYTGGTGPLLKDLIGGHIQLNAATASSVTSLIKGGQLRALAIMSAQRDPALPEVPTVVEAGYPQFESSLYFGFAVPAKTPPAIVEKLHAATNHALADKDVQARFAELAVQPKPSTPADFERFIDAELVRWRKVVDAIEGQK